MNAFSEAVSYVWHGCYQRAVSIICFTILSSAISEVEVFVPSEALTSTRQTDATLMLLTVTVLCAAPAIGTKIVVPKQIHKAKDAVDEAPWKPPEINRFEHIFSDKEIISNAQREGFTLDASNFPTVCVACARQGHAGLSILLFEYMLEKGIVCERKMVKDGIVSKFFKVVSESADDKYLQEFGVELIEAIRTHGLAPNSYIQNRLILAWRSKLPDRIVQMRMTQRKQSVSLCSTVYRCILIAREQTQPQLTLDLYDAIANLGVKLDLRVFNAALCACFNLGRVNQAVDMYEMMPMTGLVPNGKTYGLMIRFYTAADMADKALNLFQSMRAANIEPFPYTFGDAIHCYVKLNMLGKATSLHQETIQANVRLGHTIALHQEVVQDSKTIHDAARAYRDAGGHGQGEGSLRESLLAFPLILPLPDPSR